MNPQQTITKYRKDYLPPDFLIDEIKLKIDLFEDNTYVNATTQIRANPNIKNRADNLVLNGEKQTLKSIKINDKLIEENGYKLDEDTLTIFNVPEQFKLEIESIIKPQENTELTGLYKSKNIFCTQCESEGFRRITYFLDRPDVLANYTTTITADKNLYPTLLSNGNLIDSGDLPNYRHFVTWKDPFKKSCYLFAMIAGNLEVLEDHFITCSGKDVTLRIFSEPGYKDKCRFAMSSLKKAFKWDEEQYGREYDLNIFMIVAISDYNHGAMENKGLNVFNTKYIYADPKTATDTDYQRLEGVIGHEYFHNWSGNRVTCRNWFQLSLKEGLTVFRDHTFSEDMGSAGVVRIKEVDALRHTQFLEDRGPLAHPVRPDAYIEIDNFYTTTVYEKGAEVIRMMRTILGKELFRKGMDLYFERHDGQAVTCDDFVSAMEDASGIDLTQFKLWYSQTGTPEIFVTTDYDEIKKQYQVTLEQTCPKTPNQPEKLPMHIPLEIALLDKNGNEMISTVLNVKQQKQTFIFNNISEKPIPSLLRDFSAPVKLHYDYTDSELVFLIENDKDAFALREAIQIYSCRIMLSLIKDFQNKCDLDLSEEFIRTFKKILINKNLDKALIACMLELPQENYLAQFMDVIDVDAIHQVRKFVKTTLAQKLKDDLKNIYESNNIKTPYQYNISDAAKRSLKNICLDYLMYLNSEEVYTIAQTQFENTDNMTDQLAALSVLINTDCPQCSIVINKFYEMWKHEPLVIDKWFAIQALSIMPNTLQNVENLTKHLEFNIKNPNRVYALLVTFAQNNPIHFHDITGKGYKLITEYILKLNQINPQVAARITKTLTSFQRFDDIRKNLIREQLEYILSQTNLCKNVYEIVKKALEME